MPDIIDRERLLKNETPFIHENYTGISEKPYDYIPCFSVDQIERQPAFSGTKLIFEKIICNYHDGKPYYEIQYISENGERNIGYSSYNLDCVSEWLKQYFMPVIETQNHAHWIDCTDYESDFADEEPEYKCSHCNSGGHYWTFKFDYCPDCGAKMDEKV